MADPSKLKPHLRLALESIGVFTDDGRLDAGELDGLLAVALQDGSVDDEEKRVLGGILRRAEADGVDATTLARIAEVRQHLGLAG